MEFAEKLEKLGFTGFGPTNKDKTYYFSKHTEKGNHSYQLWIELKKKIPVVAYKCDYKTIELAGAVEEAVSDFLGKLDYESYIVVE